MVTIQEAITARDIIIKEIKQLRGTIRFHTGLGGEIVNQPAVDEAQARIDVLRGELRLANLLLMELSRLPEYNTITFSIASPNDGAPNQCIFNGVIQDANNCPDTTPVITPIEIQPEPEQFTLINGIEVFPNETYFVELINNLGITQSANLTKGSDIIDLVTNHFFTVKFIEESEARIIEAEVTPQNPFIRDRVTGEKIFKKEQEGKKIVRIKLLERINVGDLIGTR